MISKDILDKYKELIYKDFGKRLTDVEALESATRTFNGLEVIMCGDCITKPCLNKEGKCRFKNVDLKNGRITNP